MFALPVVEYIWNATAMAERIAYRATTRVPRVDRGDLNKISQKNGADIVGCTSDTTIQAVPSDSSRADSSRRVRVITAKRTEGSTIGISCPLPIAAPVAYIAKRRILKNNFSGVDWARARCGSVQLSVASVANDSRYQRIFTADQGSLLKRIPKIA
jgi:hypothetical protein